MHSSQEQQKNIEKCKEGKPFMTDENDVEVEERDDDNSGSEIEEDDKDSDYSDDV